MPGPAVGVPMNGLSRTEQAVLAAIRAQGQATRNEVAAPVGLSPAMAARITSRLQDVGLVHEVGRARSGGPGRHAIVLEVRADRAYVVGVDIGTEVIHLLVGDLHGEPRLYRELPSSVLRHGTQVAIVEALAGLIRQAVYEAGLTFAQVAALGVAVTGIVDSEHGVCLVRSNTPGWEDFPLANRLSTILGLPVVMEETVRAKSIAESRIGVAQQAPHFLYVDAGTSVGAGIVVDRQPFRGVSGLAGELGHVIVDPSGAVCRCGNRGCLQAVASAHALIQRARHALHNGVYSSLTAQGQELTLKDIAAAAAAGDKLALGLLIEAGERLGEAIGMALNILGLDLVVLGGVLVACTPVVLEAATRTVQLRVLPIVPRKRTLVLSTLGSDAAARGVALHAIDWLFAAPSERILEQTIAADSPAHGDLAAGAAAR